NTATPKDVAVTVNGLPVLTAPAAETVGQGHAAAVPGVTLAETGDTSAETFTATVSDTSGALTATGTGVSGSGSHTVTITGSLTQVNAALATLQDLEAAAGSDTIHLTAPASFRNTATAKDVAVTVNGLPVLTA